MVFPVLCSSFLVKIRPLLTSLSFAAAILGEGGAMLFENVWVAGENVLGYLGRGAGGVWRVNCDAIFRCSIFIISWDIERMG